ncbi:hypothetical protein [Streptomyces sp. NPDC059010]
MPLPADTTTEQLFGALGDLAAAMTIAMLLEQTVGAAARQFGV